VAGRSTAIFHRESAELTNEKKLAPSSIIIAVAALRFLYKVSPQSSSKSCAPGGQ
jgi:hypothetical protein